MDYYNEIKDTLIKNEIYKKTKDYSKNRSDLNSYFEVVRLIVEAQGGERRAKYGNSLIKNYSEKLTKELGKGYNERNLRSMRLFYIKFRNWNALRSNLPWTHYRILLSLKSIDEINYYIKITEQNNLSYRELRERIKSKEYERIGYKEELEVPKVNTLIKNPIIINVKDYDEKSKLSEYMVHQCIIEDMENFLKELGTGFAFIGHEVKIKIGDNYHRIDFLMYNIKFNCYVVIEIKLEKMKAEYIGQIKKYMNYIDKNIKEPFNDNTVGVIICKKDDKFILEYCSDDRIFVTSYKLKKSISKIISNIF